MWNTAVVQPELMDQLTEVTKHDYVKYFNNN